MPTKKIYCAGCGRERPHSMQLDRNKEILATCSECSRALKFPLVADAAGLNSLIAYHAEINRPYAVDPMEAAKREAEVSAATELFLRIVG